MMQIGVLLCVLLHCADVNCMMSSKPLKDLDLLKGLNSYQKAAVEAPLGACSVVKAGICGV